MSEPDDKLLHDWVRQSLDTFRPSYNPHDWTELQRTLKRRQWWRNGFIGSAVTLLLGLVSWFFLFTQPKNLSKPDLVKQAPKKSVRLNPDTTATSAFPASQPITTVVKTNKGNSVPKPKSNLFFSPKSAGSLTEEQITLLRPRNDIKLISNVLTERIQSVTVIAFSTEETAITQQMMTGDFGPDSTSYQILARNLRQWPKAVLVCDLTSSMYPYTTQLFTLLKRYVGNPSIQGVVFFTDCDSLGQQTYPGGPPGRMFVTHGSSLASTLPILLTAARNTVRNEDDAENDIEALLFAQKEFPEANHLILVADNISTVKDIARLGAVKKPVHVMLCGTTGSDTALAFQRDYYTIASQTNGSLHTLEDDISPKTISPGSTLKAGTRYYRYNARKKQFKLTSFTHRPRRYLNFIWL